MAPRTINNLRAAILAALASILIPALVAAAVNVQTPEDRILSKGFEAFMDGSNKQALSYFEEVIRINPDNKAARKGLEKVKIRLKKAEDAERAKNLKLAKAKTKEGHRFERTGDIVGAIDSYHAAEDAVENWKPAVKALAHIKKDMEKTASKRKLNLSDWSFARGVVAYLDRDWAKAWRIWAERSKLEPTNVALSNATARAENNFKLMMMSEQEEFFRRGARAYYEQGYYEQAKTTWAKVLEMRADDIEALEGMARAEQAHLRAIGKGQQREAHDLLEEGLEEYAQQNWRKSLSAFKRLMELDPNFTTAKEYVAKLNQKLEAPNYTPVSVSESNNWREKRPSNQSGNTVQVPTKLENLDESKKELEERIRRNPSDIRAKQDLDNVLKAQEDESERIYKDGLIAYSQGNRGMAIQYWKQVLVINPDHKKATAALRKARAEEERSAEGSVLP